MNFLITNDDGFDAPGLAALYNALSDLGTVRVSAPAVCHSAKGHAVNTHVPIRVETRTVEPFGQIDIVDGSPADCVRVGLCAPGASRPDFVVSGINPGGNLGVDMFYSGTVAAAREASILGVPSVAVSRYVTAQAGIDWDALTQHVTRVVERLISDDRQLPAGTFWNVNFPAADQDQHADEIIFAPQGTLSHDIRFREIESEQQVRLLEYVGSYQARGKTGDCDVSKVFDGKITVTPVDLCTTANHLLPANY